MNAKGVVQPHLSAEQFIMENGTARIVVCDFLDTCADATDVTRDYQNDSLNESMQDLGYEI
jgi:hypothetical protein